MHRKPLTPWLLLVIILLLINTSQASAQQERYSRVKVILDKQGHTMMELSRLGIAVDHGDHMKNQYFISDFSATEIKTMQDAGFKTDILIKDVSKHYAEQNNKPEPQKKTSSVTCDTVGKPDVSVPSRFHLGTYGGYFTYNEMLQILDSMRILYPNLISAKQEISTFHTTEGRPIYWLRISNNPDTEKPVKPQILYTALHHAREPGSLSATIFYMWHLLENYNKDPQIKAIIDNSELYFVPCVNPDGYLYNISQNPFGGGMWRKNRRNNGGSFGVDLNRNYGYQWGYDNLGSSGAGNTDVYRGPAEFSEPETRAIKWFTEQHHFTLAFNYHTFNNELLSPFGHVQKAYSPDSILITALSFQLTSNNFYRYGTCYQCLGYVSNGGSDDWMYAEQTTKNKILAFTPEVGSVVFGFYPPAFQIIPDCKDNLMANIRSASLLLPYAAIGTEDANILKDASGYIHYRLQRLSPDATGTYTVTAIPLDNWITLSTTPRVHTGTAVLQNLIDSISYTMNPATPNNQAVRYVLKVNNGYYDMTDTVEFFYGRSYAEVALSSDALTDWTSSGWDISNTEYHTAPAALKSQAGTMYPAFYNASLYLKNVIDLTYAKRAYVQYYAKWDIEPKYDYATLSVLPDGTGNITALCGKYTRPGEYGQPSNTPMYDDMQWDWKLEQMDLGPFLGQKIRLQWDMISDDAQQYKGMLVDDIKVVMVLDSGLAVRSAMLAANKLTIYPNPATDQLTIELSIPLQKPIPAVIHDCMGRQVSAFTITKQQTTIDFGHLPEQIYYLKLNGAEALPVQKIQVVH